MRLNRPLMLAAPRADEVRAERAGIDAVRERIEAGLLSDAPDRPLSGVLAAAVDALAGAAARGATAHGCIAAALDAAGREADCLAEVRARAADPSRTPQDGGVDDHAAGTEAETEDAAGEDAEAEADAPERQPVTEFTPMLDLSTAARPPEIGRPGRPHEPVDGGLLSNLTAIEIAAGTPRASARASALAALGERDAALAAIALPPPPPMRAGEMRERLARLDAQLTALGVAGTPVDGSIGPD